MKLRWLASLATMFLMSPLAHAQVLVAQPTGYVGLEAGYVKPENLNGRFAYGVDLGMKWTNGLIGSVFYDASSGSQDQADNQLTHYGVGLSYALSNTPSGTLYLGARLGAGMLEVTPNGGTKTSTTKFAVGPILGYDYMLPNMGGFSIGAQTNVLWTFFDKTQSSWYGMVNAKLWF